MLFTVNLTHLVESISADVAELGSKIDNQRHHSSQLLLLLSSSLLSTRDRLDTLASLLLVHPRFFASYGPIRPLLIELVGRNLLKLSSSPSSSKFLLNALACLIHSTPQLER